MSEFIQLHLLTNYAPSNLNRDDLGRPKTAKMGGADRLRISSQSLKRAWRTSGNFESLGVRSKMYGDELILTSLINNGIEEKTAKEWSIEIIDSIGKADEEKKQRINKLSQLVHLSSKEMEGLQSFLIDLAQELKGEGKQPNSSSAIVSLKLEADKEGKAVLKTALKKLLRDEILKKEETSVDIALFGRMLASSPMYNVEAAAQVSHAITVNSIVVEDDYFTAVDDLNNNQDNAGSAHIGESGFGSGVFYTYVCINKSLLIEGLGRESATKAIKTLTEVAATVSPSGKQNSYASRARALYILAEKGEQQPRQLSSAFLKPVDDINMANTAIDRLQKLRENMDKAYGACADDFKTMDVEKGEGTLSEIMDFVGGK